MNKPIVIDLFAEDRAHEQFLRPLVLRIASEARVPVQVRVRSARGGRGRAMQEFRSFQRLIESAAETAPDLIVVGMDGNCVSFAGKKREILEATGERHRDKVIAACPDPHIERWYLADPDSFHQVVGSRPNLGTGKCTRDFYKRALADAVRRAGHPSTLGGMEFAPELVAAMDLYRAGKAEPSLGDFLNEFRAGLRRAQVRAGGTNGSLV